MTPHTILRNETKKELGRILDYWMVHAADREHGGYFGKIDNNNVADRDAVKGAVLNARILWSFSAAYHLMKNPDHLEFANRAYRYIDRYIIDAEYGGAYWSVHADGTINDPRKHVYAIAFVLYGVSEYYKATENEAVLKLAIELYSTLINHGYDRINGGFFEAFSREWHELADQRLSAKDANTKKSTNTNLHTLEAFANLYSIWRDEGLKNHITSLLEIFKEKIIDTSSGHLKLFFDEEWNERPEIISYGHDVEASWLLLDCANISGDASLITEYRRLSLLLCDAAMKGVDKDGGLWYEYNVISHSLVREKHWWPQAEALIGLYNAWELTGSQHYLDASINSWNFITNYILSPSGEWYWGIDSDGKIMNEDKVAIWKCPYHNSRACMEIMRRTLLRG